MEAVETRLRIHHDDELLDDSLSMLLSWSSVYIMGINHKMPVLLFL